MRVHGRFVAERRQVIIIGPGSGPDAQPVDLTPEEREQMLRLPRRPRWAKDTTKEQLHEAEKISFLEWRRNLARIEEDKTVQARAVLGAASMRLSHAGPSSVAGCLVVISDGCVPVKATASGRRHGIGRCESAHAADTIREEPRCLAPTVARRRAVRCARPGMPARPAP